MRRLYCFPPLPPFPPRDKIHPAAQSTPPYLVLPRLSLPSLISPTGLSGVVVSSSTSRGTRRGARRPSSLANRPRLPLPALPSPDWSIRVLSRRPRRSRCRHRRRLDVARPLAPLPPVPRLLNPRVRRSCLQSRSSVRCFLAWLAERTPASACKPASPTMPAARCAPRVTLRPRSSLPHSPRRRRPPAHSRAPRTRHTAPPRTRLALPCSSLRALAHARKASPRP
jgi:hypothetical protein